MTEKQDYEELQQKIQRGSSDSVRAVIYARSATSDEKYDCRRNIIAKMNKAAEYLESLNSSNSMCIEEFVNAQTYDEDFHNGVDLEVMKERLLNENDTIVQRIPVKIFGTDYILDPADGRLETYDGGISMGGSLGFYNIIQRIMHGVMKAMMIQHY